MSDMEVTKAFIFDPIPVAQMIEDRVGQYLNPAQQTATVEKSELKYNNVVIKPMSKNVDTTYPAVGMEIIKTYINALLTYNSSWLKIKTYSTKDDLIKYLLPDYQNDDEVMDLLFNMLTEIRTDILQFIGNDKYVMHFMRMRNTDIVIEKTIDFRIYWYNQNVKE